MFGISGEHILIAMVVVLVFGPKNLPKMGAYLGKTLRNFKDGFSGIIEPEYKIVEKTEQTDSSQRPL